jgi:nicotinamidase-related amidase
MGADTILIAGASTDNTVLWTAADGFQLNYKVCVIEDCTMVHRPGEPPEVKEYALRIVRNVLSSDVLPLERALAKYLSNDAVGLLA